MSGALSGLKIIEMAGIGPCPLAGQLLADHGADVLIIDRASGKTNLKDVNRRNKRSIAVNLKSPKGLEIVTALVAEADVLIEGFRPGVMEKLGLGPQTCQTVNPGLVYGRMTGWGQDGPNALTAGHDLNYLATTGALWAMGKQGEPPIPPLNLVADYGGGAMFLLFGVLMALVERSASGKGQVVDAAMTDGVPAMMGLLHGMLAQGLWSPDRASNLLDGAAPFYRCYETSDGKFISLGALEPQFFAEFVRLAGLPDEHCATQNDPAVWPQRTEEYAALFKTRTRDEWAALFEGSDACVAPVLTWAEAETYPHNASRATFLTQAGTVQAAPAPRLDRTPASVPEPARGPGADTNEVLKTLGFSDTQIADLAAAGILT